MMAATLAEGETVLENAAREPEVVDLANFLIAMGAKIERRRHRPHRHRGREEAARHALRSAAGPHRDRHLPRRRRDHRRPRAHQRTRCPRTWMPCCSSSNEAGARIDVGDNWIELDMRGRRPKSVDVRTAPYPAFPTDMQAQFAALDCDRRRRRHHHRDDLREPLHAHARDAAHGRRDPPRGQHRHHQGRADACTAAPVMATDLRASASLVLAGLVGRGPHRDRAHLPHRPRLRVDRGEARAARRADPARAELTARRRAVAARGRVSRVPTGASARPRPLGDLDRSFGATSRAALHAASSPSCPACGCAMRASASCALRTSRAVDGLDHVAAAAGRRPAPGTADVEVADHDAAVRQAQLLHVLRRRCPRARCRSSRGSRGPCSRSSRITPRTRSTGIATPMPSAPRFLPSTAVLMPTSSPRRLTSAPPELPTLIAASVWMKFSKVATPSWPRPVALTMPWVTVCVQSERIADGEHDVADLAAGPSDRASSPAALAGRSCSTARSVSGSRPTTLAVGDCGRRRAAR